MSKCLPCKGFSLCDLPITNRGNLNVKNTYDRNTRAVAVPYCVLRPKEKCNS